MKFIQATVSALLFASHLLQEVASHATETRYCVTTAGNLRIFIEHWHSDFSSPGQAGTANIEDVNAGQTNILSPNGVINNLSWNQIHIPGNCAGGAITTETTTCSGRGKTYNDWVYYDFPVTCYVPAHYRLLGGNSDKLYEGCSNLYPADIQATFTDQGPPIPTVNGIDCISGGDPIISNNPNSPANPTNSCVPA